MTTEARTRKTVAWLRYARADLKLATALLAPNSDAEPYHIGFLAQQAAEKALKAALTYAALPLDPTHDLNDLARQLPVGWRARQLAGGLERLTRFAVDTRYPATDPPPSSQEAQQAVRQATALVRAVARDLHDQGLPLKIGSVPRKRASAEAMNAPIDSDNQQGGH